MVDRVVVPVSVVIPFRDRSVHIVRNAVSSYLWQDVSPLEVIVVDYGSTDDYAEMVARETAVPGFSCMHVEPRAEGVWSEACAANAGIRASRGVYVMVTGIDFMLAPNFIKALWERHEEGHTGPYPVDLPPRPVFIMARTHWLDGIPWTREPFRERFSSWREVEPRGVLAAEIHRHAILSAPRRWWFDVHGFDERVAGGAFDLEIMNRVGGIRVVDICNPNDSCCATSLVHQPHDWQGKEDGDEYWNMLRLKSFRDASLVKNDERWGAWLGPGGFDD